jgi:hypothetical protein
LTPFLNILFSYPVLFIFIAAFPAEGLADVQAQSSPERPGGGPSLCEVPGLIFKLYQIEADGKQMSPALSHFMVLKDAGVFLKK